VLRTRGHDRFKVVLLSWVGKAKLAADQIGEENVFTMQ
jgi:hypothetical protein